ncbi:MAG: hypothetical protein M1834_006169 [Cirrosporium novae-zelandiae]|nr:MAG: hypothetical protein M1834_006169 [Cirrosporium novae-zelandiae]
MSTNPAIPLAETLQSASIDSRPSPSHDINPSTAASKRTPVEPHSLSRSSRSSSISSSVLRPIPRKHNLPPLPDLRFEQSYLRSIEGAEGWGKIGWITVRDQVLLPLAQGTLWTLLLSGWRYWNGSSEFKGKGIGAIIRRWWWKINNWKIPSSYNPSNSQQIACDVEENYTKQLMEWIDE